MFRKQRNKRSAVYAIIGNQFIGSFPVYIDYNVTFYTTISGREEYVSFYANREFGDISGQNTYGSINSFIPILDGGKRGCSTKPSHSKPQTLFTQNLHRHSRTRRTSLCLHLWILNAVRIALKIRESRIKVSLRSVVSKLLMLREKNNRHLSLY